MGRDTSLAPEHRRVLARLSALATLSGIQVVSQSNATLRVRVDGIPVDIVRYPYALLEPPIDEPAGIPIASLRDLAASKLSAVAKRGIRRDFWDLYAMRA